MTKKRITPNQFNQSFIDLKDHILICPKCEEEMKIDESGRETMSRYPMVRVRCKNEYCKFESLIYSEIKVLLSDKKL